MKQMDEGFKKSLELAEKFGILGHGLESDIVVTACAIMIAHIVGNASEDHIDENLDTIKYFIEAVIQNRKEKEGK